MKGPCDACGSSDARHTYPDGHQWCFVCDAGEWPNGAPSAPPTPKRTPLEMTGFIDKIADRKLSKDTCTKFGITQEVDSNVGDGRKDGVTGKCLVMVTPDAERTMNTFLGITETFSVDELHHDAIKNSEYLYIEGYLVTSDTGRHAAIEARKIAEEAGVKTALTFSDPAMVEFFKSGLAEMLGDGVDLLFCNEAEAKSWSGSDDLNQALESLKSVAKTFAVTLGSKGAMIYDGKQMIEISPHQVKAIDSNGAGDMFAGAFIYGITHGHSFYEAGNIASLAAARVVSQFGPRLKAEGHKDIINIVLAK